VIWLRCIDDARKDLMARPPPALEVLAAQRAKRFPGRAWTAPHEQWLRTRSFEERALARDVDRLLLRGRRARGAPQGVDICAGAGCSREQSCAGDRAVALFRGIDTLSAAGLCAEVSSFERFAKADATSQGSSGSCRASTPLTANARRGQITKAGPTHARRVLVEAAHHYVTVPRSASLSRPAKSARIPRVIQIAWRAQRRLHARLGTPRRRARQTDRDGRGRPSLAELAAILLGGRHTRVTRQAHTKRVPAAAGAAHEHHEGRHVAIHGPAQLLWANPACWAAPAPRLRARQTNKVVLEVTSPRI